MNHKPIDMSKLEVLHLHDTSAIEELLEFKKDHLLNLCTPSISSSYSICVEYMRNWFIRKFQSGYFKSEFISGKNILADYLKKDILDFVKRNKPSLLISPRLDFEFTRDFTDSYMYGNKTYYNRARFKDAFFKDPIHQNLLSIEMEQLRVNFRFAIKVSEYNHAIDLFKYMQTALNGGTETHYIDLDFQVPKTILLAIAQDSGFEIKDNNIVENIKFLKYLNTYSQLPFAYKFRGTKGEYEYFIRLCNMYTHLRSSNIDLSDGDREGQLDNNFISSIEVECLFPAPKFYAYYSKNNHTFVNKSGSPMFTFKNLCFDAIPTTNEKGWNQYMSSDYIEEDKILKNSPIEIEFKDLLKSDYSNSLFAISEYIKSIFISPSAFIDIKLFNSGEQCKIDIDWNTYKIKTKLPLPERLSTIVFYIDMEYVNNFTINDSKAYSTRLKDADDDSYLS